MIRSKQHYTFYLEADRVAIGKKGKNPFFGDKIWKFERLLRKVEYYHNCKRSIFWKPYILYLKWRYHSMGVKLGFTIPKNVFGPGLSIAHIGTIVVNGNAKVGANCRLHTCVTIGTKAGHSGLAPKIGNNVYIGPGAKLFGDIKIADGIAIGANSVVNRSFMESNISIAGVPAKKISDKGSEDLLVKATETL
ncbi:serine acetyltransferase [Methanococcoides orientis]|uniref:serine O-acetyltransferase n=1 Tax=Methanococcoides orientis TaxID=2822137 RepID=UPI001E415882|nr:serine acetyltransferase [Methanococcoides orientis]UGV40629.1 serine acetyltransferase [Methanococcoides orientis]